MKVIFEGWEPGMRKIPFIELLKEKAGLSLSEAKNIKDRLVDNGEVITLNLEDKIVAKDIVERAKDLKVKARIEEE